jgi:predicted AAA+ superfamily ATPase
MSHNHKPPLPDFRRSMCDELSERLRDPRRFIQVLSGPRQAGKTTIALQVADEFEGEPHYASADEPGISSSAWVEQQWNHARFLAGQRGDREVLLILDEVHKLAGWSDQVKKLWDEDSRAGSRVKVVLLGSAPLLMLSGLTESLAGRFETIRVPHWSFTEMHEAFGLDLATFVYFGGYPGAVPLIGDRDRWAAYIRDSLIETTLSRDILLMSRIHKPALLRRLFQLACDYSAQVLSFNKMLGQLEGAGNTTTLAHYLELLSGAGIVCGIGKYSGSKAQLRASSPKLLAMNTALISATDTRSPDEALADRSYWGRLVESAIGAHLLAGAATSAIELHYWRERDREVDFVLARGDRIVALEVKSGLGRRARRGAGAFLAKYPRGKALVVGGDGIPVEEFLATDVRRLLE